MYSHAMQRPWHDIDGWLFGDIMDQKTKQRLTGAIVLVALAVIFVPIILEGPDNEWTPRSHSIPEQPQMDYRASMELEIPEQPAAPPEAAPQGAITGALGLPERTAEAPATEPLPEASTPAQGVKADPPEKPEPAASKPAETAKTPAAPATRKPEKPADDPIKGSYVQVGSVGQEMNASGQRDRLKAAGFDARLQKAEIGKGYAYRVLVGPATSRAAAEKNAASLKQKQQLAGMVIEYP